MGKQWDKAMYALAYNQATPADVLLRLLGHEHRQVQGAVVRRGNLPPDVIEAILAHPERHVRGTFAESVAADPVQRARILDDPDPGLAICLAMGPMPYRQPVEPLPDEAYARLLAHPRVLVRRETAGSGSVPLHILAGLADHEEPELRREACRAWDLLSPAVREALLADEAPDVREAAAFRVCGEDEERTTWLAGHVTNGWVLHEVLRTGRLSRELAERLIAEGDQRAKIAGNPSLPPDLVAKLAVDPDPGVRLVISARPELSESERAAIDYTVGPESRLGTLDWVWKAREDAELLRRCARSAHPWLRRSAAVCPGLRPDAVALLAGDEDFAVRLLLCEFHPEPPPELLLDLYLNGAHRAVGMLVARPGFPAAGLAARFGDSPDPVRRRLALRDPALDPALLDRLSRDPQTLDDAGRDPRLPLARILELLADPDTAAGAAGNPALPPEEMRRLLDRAGVAV
uniref:LRV domain-containing protein n=1 Tax=Streptomyces sp. NBC_00049 TaxID=2903617 RepID=A0AAU2JJ87_9ACTN